MRIRSTKPEFWRSERVAGVGWDARLVLKGLESYVDDNGVGKDDLALIVADVFPRDLSRNPPGTLKKVSEALGALSKAGLLWRYEVDGTRLLYVAFWESIQRIEKPTKGRFRRPDGTMDYRESHIRESSGNPPGTLPEDSGLEQGNRGTGEQGRTDLAIADAPAVTDPDLFDEFWESYPRKASKAGARKAWRKALKTMRPTEDATSAERLVTAARYWANLWRNARTETQYIPYPTTWLNQERWNDDPPAKPRVTPDRASTTDQRVAAVLALARPEQIQLPGAAS